jgi:hypothetical protein
LENWSKSKREIPIKEYINFKIMINIKVKIKSILFSPFRILSYLFFNNKKITIVTCASSNHFRSVLQLINSIKLIEKGNFEIIVYDLGLLKTEIDFFEKINPDISLKLFDFSKYPSFYNIRINVGAYAWKPAIIFEEYSSLKRHSFLLWLDAGCFLSRSLLLVRFVIMIHGLYCTFSGGLIKNFTFSSTLNKIGNKDINDLKMFQASTIGLKVGTRCNENLIKSWFINSKQEHLIAPIGSSLSNHRYDQSLLSVEIYKSYNRFYRPLLSYQAFEISLHKDIG